MKDLSRKAFLNGFLKGLAAPCLLFTRSSVLDVKIPDRKVFKLSSPEDDAKKFGEDFRKALGHVR